jgi:MtN3 and saliva related transmembrane protein
LTRRFAAARRRCPNLAGSGTKEFSDLTLTTLIGLGAATCTTVAYVPQVIKAWRTRSTTDISMGTFLLLFVGITLWLIYGVILRDPPLILANLITLCLATTILVFKLRFG